MFCPVFKHIAPDLAISYLTEQTNQHSFPILIFRALGREGKAYLKKGDDDNALRFLNKSLSEHRTADISKLVNEVCVDAAVFDI